MASFSAKVADEYIHPKPPGHILLVLEQTRIFGIPEEEVIACKMLADCRGILEFKRGLLYEGTLLELVDGYGHRGAGGTLGAGVETSAHREIRFSACPGGILPAPMKKPIWEVHSDGILGHGEFNRVVLQRILEEGLVETRPGFSFEYSPLTAVDFYGLFFDGVYNRSIGNSAGEKAG